MMNKKQFSHTVSIIGWGALLIWWGICIAIDPITLGMSAVGTGLILLGVNAARMMKGVRTIRSTTVIGIIALAWGALDMARSLLHLSEGVSFALMFVVIGLGVWMTLLFPERVKEEAA